MQGDQAMKRWIIRHCSASDKSLKEALDGVLIISDDTYFILLA